MTTTLTTPTPEVKRDRWGRPLIVPPNGGKPVAYTRCTTFVDCLEDKFNLQKWQQRMVATGLADRPDLLLSVSAHREDKRELDRICEAAREAAAASAAATTGTALHALTELLDRGQPLPVLPDAVKADLDAYAAATSSLTAVAVEQFLVQDPLKIGGTTDRVVKVGKKRYIADIKTGSIEYGILKIAMQLAVYARSRPYDIDTGERGDHGAEFDRGLIIHLPAGTGACRLVWVDLLEGWNAVQIARDVRVKRGLKFADLTEPYVVEDKPTKAAATPKAQAVQAAPPSLLEQINACATPDAVRALWAAHAAEWDDALTEAAKSHITKLPTVA